MIFLKSFKNQKDILHGILERKDGSVNPFYSQKSQQNILKAAKQAWYKNAKFENLVFTEQTHSSNVYFFEKDKTEHIKLKADGLVTDTKGKILTIKTADCVPVLIYSKSQKRIGAIHIGRRGLIKGILEKALKLFDSDISYLTIGIGPHIRKCCYFLRGESKSYVHDPKWNKYIEKRNKNLYFDLTKGVIDILLKAGVKKQNIEDCNICTFCQSEKFFSSRKNDLKPDFYKKDKIDGKLPCFATFITLKQLNYN